MMGGPSDDDIRRVLLGARVIAMVGASPDPARPSFGVGQFLVARGYRVIPVNPKAAGDMLFGETVVADLSAAREADMVDVFRRSDAVPAVMEEALRVLPKLCAIWLQLGVRHPQAAGLARAGGVDLIEDRCPAIEFRRLGLRR